MKAALEPSVSLEFDSYFFFLRKFHYIAMDREAQLKLTDQGERVVDGDCSTVLERGGRVLRRSAPRRGQPRQAVVDETRPDACRRRRRSCCWTRPRPTASGLDARRPCRRRRGCDAGARAAGSSPHRIPPLPARCAPVRAAAPPRRPPSPPRSPSPGHHLSARRRSLRCPLPPPSARRPSGAAAKGADLDLRYQKFDPIGTGPLGTVFKGRYNALGLDICIKELKDIFGYFSFLQRGEVLKRLKKELCAQAAGAPPGGGRRSSTRTSTSRGPTS